MRNVWMSLGRLGRIVRVLLVHGLALLADRHSVLARWLPGPRLTGPERLRAVFEDLGGTFVKFGQMLAMQPDIVPLEYCDALLKLLDRMDPFPFSEAERTLREELGRGPDELFDAFEREPIATASVGQVYAAWLQGKKVAVKVQRPNVHVEFGNDVRLMVGAMHLIRFFHVRPFYWMLAPTSEFVAWSGEELDYRNEARYSEELRRHAVGNPIQHVPAVLGRHTSRRVLTVEFLEGITLLDAMRALDQRDEAVLRRLEELGFDQDRFASNIISNFLGDAFRYGIYHADLHPANLMVLRGNVVGYIDFGITGLMSPYSRRHLVAMTLALAQGDLEGMYREYLMITSHDESSGLEAFHDGLEVLANTWYEDAGGGRRRLRTKITRIFAEMLQLSRQTNVMPERDIVKYIRSAISIDGLLARFAPGFDIGIHLATACSRYLKWEARRELLTPEHLLDWSTASSRLFADGPARLSRALGQIARSGTDPVKPERPEGAEERAQEWRVRVLTLAGAVFGTSLLIAANSGPWRPGLNLLTAELVFLGAAGTLLAGSLAGLRRRTLP